MKKEIPVHVATRMMPENLLSEVSQTEAQTLSDSTYVGHLEELKSYRGRRGQKAPGDGERETESYCLMGLEPDGGELFDTLSVLNATELSTETWFDGKFCLMYILPQQKHF